MSKNVILITGTNSGFGWLTAQTAAEKGHTVYATMRDISGRNKEKADQLSQIKNITVLNAEVTDAASVNQAVETIINKEGRLDVVVNNAGYFAGGPMESFTVEDLERIFDVHVKGSWRVIKAALPYMRKQRAGLIINTSSILARFSLPMMGAYNASKFALEGLTESLHYELKHYGVDAVIIQPGPFPTEVGSKASTGSDGSVMPHYEILSHGMEETLNKQGQMFQTVKPDPQLIADAIIKLIDTPKGSRPLRTVVDPATGFFVEKANAHTQGLYKDFAISFGIPASLV